jgi:hypothetical protein
MHNRNLFWGILITFIGLFLLCNQMLDVNLGKFLFPVILILFGVWFLVAPSIRKGEMSEEHIYIPLDGASEADIRLNFFAGKLNLHALDSSSDLIAGTCFCNLEESVSRHGDRLKVKLEQQFDFFNKFSPMWGQIGSSWNIGLSRHIPLKLSLKGGAEDACLDLTLLKIQELHLKTGASATQINLPAEAGSTFVSIAVGAASVNIRIPEGVAGRIRSKESAIASIKVDTIRFPSSNSGFQSDDYDTSTNKVDIVIKAGVGSVEIH